MDAERRYCRTAPPRSRCGRAPGASICPSEMTSHSRTVLLAEDDPVALQALADELPRALPGLVVLRATSGREAVGLLDTHKVHMVATDLRMPAFDGFELIAWLREHRPGTPVLVMSAFLPDSDTAEARLLEGVECLRKPLSLCDVVTAIKDQLGRGVRGEVQDIPLAAFLQLLEMERKSCRLDVRQGDRAGRLFVDRGRLVHALLGELAGEAAALEIVGWERPRIRIRSGCGVIPQTLDRSLGYLLMESARLRDESGAPEAPRVTSWPPPPSTAEEWSRRDVTPMVPMSPPIMQEALTASAAPTAGSRLSRLVDLQIQALRSAFLVDLAAGSVVERFGDPGLATLTGAVGVGSRLAGGLERPQATTGLEADVEETVVVTDEYLVAAAPLDEPHALVLVLVFERARTNLAFARLDLRSVMDALSQQ